MDLKTVCIFDIDGTLANCDHRLHYVQNKPKNWEAFYSECMDDLVIPPVAEMLKLFSENNLIYIVTGRPERNRELTEAWLKRHEIHFNKLIMRGDRDFRKSPDYKSAVCDSIERDGYKIGFAIEDRLDCVEMFIKRGLFCFNVSNGAFHDI
jgi:uncharacterized HAD superfamily protein